MYKFSDSISFGGFNEVNNMSEQEREKWHIINLSKRSSHYADIFIPLNDGVYDGGNTQEEFANAVNSVRKSIKEEKNVFVHCAHGQSRSVSVLATALAAENDKSFESILKKLMDIRSISSEPERSLQSKAKLYLRHTT